MDCKKVLESSAVVRFNDCDPFGHLNNSRYIDYFYNAREDQLIEHYGLSLAGLAQKQGVGWMVGGNQLAYFRSAGLMEEVKIETQLIEYGPKVLRVEGRMYSADKSEIKALIWAQFVHVDLKRGGAAKHSSELMDLFEAVHLPVEAKVFEERVVLMRARTQKVPA